MLRGSNDEFTVRRHDSGPSLGGIRRAPEPSTRSTPSSRAIFDDTSPICCNSANTSDTTDIRLVVLPVTANRAHIGQHGHSVYLCRFRRKCIASPVQLLLPFRIEAGGSVMLVGYA